MTKSQLNILKNKLEFKRRAADNLKWLLKWRTSDDDIYCMARSNEPDKPFSDIDSPPLAIPLPCYIPKKYFEEHLNTLETEIIELTKEIKALRKENRKNTSGRITVDTFLQGPNQLIVGKHGIGLPYDEAVKKYGADQCQVVTVDAEEVFEVMEQLAEQGARGNDRGGVIFREVNL